MDQGPLVSEEIDAGAELVHQFGDYLPVKAAFWLKASDTSIRYLYIASEQINDGNFDVAYREVVKMVALIRSPYLNPFRVKVVGGTNPLAQVAASLNERFPGPSAMRYGAMTFGGISVDDVYIYLLPLAAVAV